MFDWSLLWKVFLPGAVALSIILERCFGLFGTIFGIIKALWPSRAKPQLLDVKECVIYLDRDVFFKLLINNAGSKDCSVTSVELVLVKGYPADLGLFDSTLLPKTIMAGRAELVVVSGKCTKLFTIENKVRTRLVLQPEQKSIEGEVTVKFNTGKIIKKNITFTIRRP